MKAMRRSTGLAGLLAGACAALLLAACGGSTGPGDAAARDVPADLADAADEATADPGADPAGDPGDDTAIPDIAPDPIPEGLDPEAFAMDPAAPEPVVEVPDGVALRVATLNVYGFHFATPEAIGTFLAGLAPDLVMLEEIGVDDAARVAAAGDFPYHAAGSSDEALLSMTPLSDVAEVPLVNGRGLLHATTVVDGATFSVYGAHISWNVDGNLQARQIAREVVPADPLSHLVMAGDFNDEHYSTQNDYLDETLVDAATAMGWYPGQHISWPSTGFDETEGAQTIDLVFSRRSMPALVTGLDVMNLSPVLSDHKPVVADLLYPRGDEPFATDPFAAGRDPFATFPAPADRPPNLLANPGAEDGLDGWEVGGGAQAAAVRLHLLPRTGAALFTGYDAPTDLAAPWSWGMQTVDLSGRAAVIDAGRGRLYASAWMASGSLTVERDGEVSNELKTYSDGEVIVETLDDAGGILGRTVSGRRDTLAWHPFAAVVDVPPRARAARVTFLAHHKSQAGALDGAGFDDLYLGFADAGEAHRLAGGTEVSGGGAEPGGPAGVTIGPGWAEMPDGLPLGPWGVTMFPPYCASGKGCWMAHPRVDPDADPVTGPQVLSAEADLSAFAADVDAGRLALRSGAWLRTMNALTSATLALVVLDADGTPWATFESAPVRAGEWTRVALLTRMPQNARRVRLEVRAPLDREDDTVFADELALVPERAAPAQQAAR